MALGARTADVLRTVLRRTAILTVMSALAMIAVGAAYFSGSSSMPGRPEHSLEIRVTETSQRIGTHSVG